MRFFALSICGLGLAASSHASFELLMVLDYGTKSVHRFDSNSGAYLGSFGGGYFNNPQGLIMDRALNRAYVYDSTYGLYRAFDYNTGEHVSDFAGYGNGFQCFGGLPGGNILAGYLGGAAYELSNSGVGLGYRYTLPVSGSSGVALGSTVHSSGRILTWTGALDNSAHMSIQVLGTTLSSTATYQSSVITNMGTYFTQAQIAVGGNNGAVVNTVGNIQYFTTPSDGSSVTLGSNISLTSYLTGPRGVAYGHGSTLYVSGINASNAAQGRILRTTHGFGFGTTFGEGILVNPGQMAIVVAPEPGTWAALGLGALTLMRRRNRGRRQS